jgi:hypothetical protein
MLWVGMGGHRSLLMDMVWVWVQIRRKMLGSGVKRPSLCISFHILGEVGEELKLSGQSPTLPYL